MPNDLTDGRLSDTELLLRPSAFVSQESFREQHRQRSPSPSKENVDQNCTSGKRHLNLEELECDVSVEGCSPDQTSGQRQEFSFTLYDLDGHGKITKDDIAGLVKTIYETLGQSIKVPHYGSKTIKVKLTVSPEKKACKSSEEESPTFTKTPDVSSTGFTPNCNRWRNDLNSSKTRERRHRQEQKLRRRHSISSSGLSEDREADVSDDDDDEVPLNNKLHNPAIVNTSPTTIYSRYKKRSSSLQRQELLQIIQANMEKNNLCFQTARKPTANNTYYKSHYRHRNKPQPVTRQFVNNWETPVQPEDKCGKMFLNSFELKNIDPRHLHQRSHSYDVPNNRYVAATINDEKKAKQPTTHELKHRYRELEQARANEQVVRWLEQEFSSPTKYCNRKNHNNNLNNNSKTTSKEEVKSKGRSCSNDKHEHHHIHEHVHHHYHHYQESPIVV
ncbi:protein naked cuticle homolog 1 isoform X2 [Planococcus citri]